MSAGPEPPLSCDLRLNHATNRPEHRKSHYQFKLTPLMRVVERLLGQFYLSTVWSNMLIGVGIRR